MAVLNFVVHKDYSTGNPIHIKIYDDKVIIYNDWQLPPNVLPESLLRGVISKLHNPLIANAFFRSGQIEAWGRGIEKMRNGCVEDDLPEPVFKISPTTFSICFSVRNNNKAIDELKIYSVNNSGINNGINEIRQRIIKLMLSDPNITTQKIADEIGIDRRNAESHIRGLKKLGLVKRIGARKKGQWLIRQNL